MFLRPAVLLFALLLPGSGLAAVGQDTARPVIVSTNHPKDSLGETVYEHKGEKDKNEAVIPGVLSYPKPLNAPKPKFSKAMKKAKYQGVVTVEGVITQSGDVIDLEALQPADPEAAQAALQAVSQYKFKPSTLDGKPAAIRLRVEVKFRIY